MPSRAWSLGPLLLASAPLVVSSCSPAAPARQSSSRPSLATPLRPAPAGSGSQAPRAVDVPMGIDPQTHAKWDPGAVDMTRPAYCENAPRLERFPATHPKSRMARYALDEGCTRHHGNNLLCASGNPINPVSAPAKSCIDVEIVSGDPPKYSYGEGDQYLVCVDCPSQPEGITPAIGRQCEDADWELVRGGGKPIFNLPGPVVERIEDVYKHAMNIKNQHIAANDWIWQLRLLDVVRLFAIPFGYCEKQPYGTVGTPPQDYSGDGGHRMDLNRVMVWAGEDATMGVTGQTSFSVGMKAFIKSDADPSLDLDSLGLALAHEMHHMGTKNFGGGDEGTLPHGAKDDEQRTQALYTMNARIANAEHMLNELEDYKIMFQHPWVKLMDAAALARARDAFRFGEDQERSCFAWQWMASYSAAARVGGAAGGGGPVGGAAGSTDDGYPPDGRNGRPMGPPAPVAGFTVNKDACQGDVLTGTPEERCAVALWANGNPWMQAQMLRSMVPQSFVDWNGSPHPSDAQPWNVLAHWVMGIPFRQWPYCTRDDDGTIHAGPPPGGDAR